MLSALADGVQVEDRLGNFRQKHFLVHTRPRQDNLDYSVPGFDKQGDRVFWGTETAYDGFAGAVLYGFAVVQRDKSSENPDLAGQAFKYDSEYYGAGGVLTPRDTVEVWAEGVLQRGRSFTDSLRESRVEASAFLSGFKYRPKWRLRPVLEAQYAYGSGDGDRASVTNTLGGDLDGRDGNFLYHGYYLGGYALQPRLSNLHVTSVGASFSPFAGRKPFENMALGTRYYWFRKDEREGGTSDLESVEASADMGTEWDLYLHWGIRHDLVASLRYGLFMPGGAFPAASDDDTEYFASSLTYSF